MIDSDDAGNLFQRCFSADYAVNVKQTDAFEQARAQIEAVMRDIEAILPKVRDFMSGSEFGREALSKADQALQRTKTAIGARSLDELSQSKEPLERTLRMLRGVAQKMG